MLALDFGCRLGARKGAFQNAIFVCLFVISLKLNLIKSKKKMGKNLDKICKECDLEPVIKGRKWAEHCKTTHNKDSKNVWY